MRIVSTKKIVDSIYQNERKHFCETCQRQLSSQNVGKLVERERCSNGVGLWQRARKVIVTISNSNIFHHVTRVKNVTSGRGDANVKLVFIRRSRSETHFVQQTVDFVHLELVQAGARTNVVSIASHGAIGHVGRNLGVLTVFVNNFDFLITKVRELILE
jgi:hypothetical protein